MNSELPISDEVLELANRALSKGEHWMAYNQSLYFIVKEDVRFFNLQNEANQFANDNLSDRDAYQITYFNSILDIIKKITYRQNAGMDLMNDPDINGLHNHEGNPFTDSLIEHIEQQQLSLYNSQLKTNVMNQKNLDYLSDQVKFTGFGETLGNDLKEKTEKQTPEFQLTHNTKFGNDDLQATLHFKKSDQTDMYFFNRYDVALKPENQQDKMEQTFYIGKENNITLKEAYNLMNGRSVNKDLTNKEGQVYNAWMQLDFKQTNDIGNYKMQQFHQNYGYDLESVLAKHPIKELNNEQEKSRLIQSLQKGNRQSATFIQNGNEQKNFIEANPQFKTITIYDNNMHRLDTRQSKGEKQSSGEAKTEKEGKKESAKQAEDDGPEAPKAAKKSRKKQSQSIS